VTVYREPSGPGVRVDSGIRAGDEISGLYDPMIAKLIVHDVDREHARRRMLRALEEFVIAGPPTLVGFHRALLEHPCFVAGATCDGIVESEELAEAAQQLEHVQLSHLTTRLASASDGAGAASRTGDRLVSVEVDGRAYEVRVQMPEPPWAALARLRRGRASTAGPAGSGAIVSPMQGTVLQVEVANGDHVVSGQVLCVVEAMKMENEIASPYTGVVSDLEIQPGSAVISGQVLCVVQQEQEDDAP
jgi:acetyl-CoA/propionyl-CoA carboxylase biotin carboxyl carrier protein